MGTCCTFSLTGDRHASHLNANTMNLFGHLPIYGEDGVPNQNRRWGNFSAVLAMFFQLLSVGGWAGTNNFSSYGSTQQAGIVFSILASICVTLTVLSSAFEWRTNIVRVINALIAVCCQVIFMAIWTSQSNKMVNTQRDVAPSFLFGFGWGAFGNSLAAFIQLLMDFLYDAKR